jgi:hypothetical protein
MALILANYPPGPFNCQIKLCGILISHRMGEASGIERAEKILPASPVRVVFHFSLATYPYSGGEQVDLAEGVASGGSGGWQVGVLVSIDPPLSRWEKDGFG